MCEAVVDVAFPGDAFFVESEAGEGREGGLEGVPEIKGKVRKLISNYQFWGE